jgi:rubrerythrin
MNLDTLLKQAMELEKIQAMIYKGLEKKFSFSEEISRFWAGLAEDEKGHYERIVNMRNQFGPEELSVEVDNNLYDTICNGLRELRLSRLEDVANLHDACELAAEVENYETVAVFEFVHNRFKYDPQRLVISKEIFAHLDKLADFSDRFKSLDERRSIKAIP